MDSQGGQNFKQGSGTRIEIWASEGQPYGVGPFEIFRSGTFVEI
jgi:hypothetical protein